MSDVGHRTAQDVELFNSEAAIRVDKLEAALEELLDVAERIRGGDTKLDPERWYAARDYARSVLRKA